MEKGKITKAAKPQPKRQLKKSIKSLQLQKRREENMYEVLRIKKRIAKNIKDVRVAKNLSLYQLAKSCGLRRETPLSIEDGEKAYTVDALLSVCRALGIENINVG